MNIEGLFKYYLFISMLQKQNFSGISYNILPKDIKVVNMSGYAPIYYRKIQLNL